MNRCTYSLLLQASGIPCFQRAWAGSHQRAWKPPDLSLGAAVRCEGGGRVAQVVGALHAAEHCDVSVHGVPIGLICNKAPGFKQAAKEPAPASRTQHAHREPVCIARTRMAPTHTRGEFGVWTVRDSARHPRRRRGCRALACNTRTQRRWWRGAVCAACWAAP